MILNLHSLSFHFEITHTVSDQIALHSVQLPLFVMINGMTGDFSITIKSYTGLQVTAGQRTMSGQK